MVEKVEDISFSMILSKEKILCLILYVMNGRIVIIIHERGEI